MRIAIFEAMSGKEDRDQRLWFVIDELDALGPVEGLKDALARLRKFGGRCVLGFQSIAQVSGTYGAAGAQTIVENCGNTLILRCSGSENGGTSQFASRLIGDREVIRRQTTRGSDREAALSARGARRSRNTSEQHVTEAGGVGVANRTAPRLVRIFQDGFRSVVANRLPSGASFLIMIDISLELGMSDPSRLVDINIRSRRYFIARSVTTCPACRSRTEVLGVGVPAGFETLIPDDTALTEDDAHDIWEAVPQAAFFFHIDQIPRAVSERVTRLSDSFRFVTGADVAVSHWSNHCAHCNLPLDDQELFCEPGGAFVPLSIRRAKSVRLSHVDEPFAASAAGCAYQPEFFEFMSWDGM